MTPTHKIPAKTGVYIVVDDNGAVARRLIGKNELVILSKNTFVLVVGPCPNEDYLDVIEPEHGRLAMMRYTLAARCKYIGDDIDETLS